MHGNVEVAGRSAAHHLALDRGSHRRRSPDAAARPWVAEEVGVNNLEKVDHIVVLMPENRSFDHMLGYLSLEGGRCDVDGLRPEFANKHDGHSYPIHHLDSTAIADDPDHSPARLIGRSADRQIGGGAMDCFVTSFAHTLSRRGVEDGDPARVMGYYNAADVPVYDHLAREFAVCDRWFSSVPGATWPNRLYAICGRAAGRRDDLPHNLPPLYKQPSFVRHLDAGGITWRWYSFVGARSRRSLAPRPAPGIPSALAGHPA
jgi:phospholipase C